MKKLAFAVALAFAASGALAQDKTIKVTGFGAKTGPVRSFGVNSEAAIRAAADAINKQGGVKLADGSKAKIEVDFLDDGCNAEQGISVVRRVAGSDALIAIGPTCSNVAMGARCRRGVALPRSQIDESPIDNAAQDGSRP